MAGRMVQGYEAAGAIKAGHFLCSLRSLRLYRRAKTSAMNPITAKVVNAMSTFVIVINLHYINNKSCDKEEHYSNKSYPQRMFRKLIRNKVSYYRKTHYKFVHIITILGEVVYLLFVHHIELVIAMNVPDAKG